jgi:hypothetical protein
MKRGFVKQVASFFALFGVVFIPFPFYITQIQSPVTNFLFGRLIRLVAENVFGKKLADTHVHSDTFSMYILVLLLFILAILTSLLLLRIKKWTLLSDKVLAFIYQLICYYLVLQLLKYGLGKIFKNQFYIPEPNTLYTALGRMSKGLLYWSSMGTSHFYNVFLGSLEALAAIFILIKRTRLVGLLISLAVMLNVVAVNFGFDISVKLYSLFLFYLTIYLLAPYFSRLNLLLLQKTAVVIPASDQHILFRNTFLPAFLKCLATGIIFVEVFYPIIKTRNFNDDRAERPYLHGAYEVKQVISGTDTLPVRDSPVKRFFIHKMGHMIFQDQDDNMQDYKLSYDKNGSALILTDYQLHRTVIPFTYRSSDSILTIHYSGQGKEYKLAGKALDWRKLPAVKKRFHWTSDEGE